MITTDLYVSKENSCHELILCKVVCRVSLPKKRNLPYKFGGTALASFTTWSDALRGEFDISEFGAEHFSHLLVGMMCVEECYKLLVCIACPCRVQEDSSNGHRLFLLILVAEPCNIPKLCKCVSGIIVWQGQMEVGHNCQHTRSVRKVSDRIFLCEHLMDYNLARLHEPTLNLSAHA
jgi:hypothetical protein